jgi:predicted RNase H-like nuclease (RuvC/YqgF family)
MGRNCPLQLSNFQTKRFYQLKGRDFNMKKLIQLIIRLFGNKKVIDLDNDGKIETLREEVAGVFSQFKRMSDKLTEVNVQLEEVISEEELAKVVEREQLERIIEEANRKLAESDKRIEKASAEINANEKLKEKVSEFIV